MRNQMSLRRIKTTMNYDVELSSKRIALSAAFLVVSGVMVVSSYEGIEVMPRDHESVIGDLMRSEESASTFFNMVDRDGDGKLRAPEVAKFLRESIGGTNFDEATEVDNEVSRVMKKLDKNRDNILDQSDFMAHWTHLESLLTVDEVAEWVVYAVQLPEHIGNIFRDNVVTGYDFPELVEDGGVALEIELGITKSSFRRKIVRLIQARMLGIGSTPTMPQNVKYTVESCSSVHFYWDKSTSKGFPIHSYRLQRRKVGGNSSSSNMVATDDTINNRDNKIFHPILEEIEGSKSNESNNNNNNNNNISDNSLKVEIDNSQSIQRNKIPSVINSASEWKVIGLGRETEFVDSTLEPGVEYYYRIQAWNSVGHSGWAKIDFQNESRKKKCKNSKKKPKIIHQYRSLPPVDHKDDDEQNDDDDYDDYSVWQKILIFFQHSCTVATFFANMARILMSSMAIAVTIMKFKRASVKSTYSSNDPIFQWFFKGINSISLQLIGMEIIPKIMIDSDPLSQFQYDETVKAVGLHGYDKINNTPRPLSTRSIELYGGYSPALKTMTNRKCISERPTDNRIPSRVKRKFPRSGSFFKGMKDNHNNNCTTNETSMRSLVSDLSEVDSHDTNNDIIIRQQQQQSLPLESQDVTTTIPQVMDDMKFCTVCQKKYKFPKRFRHHCSRCATTFCHKHGKTTHSNLIACGVPGTCLCNSCVQELQEQQNMLQQQQKSQR